MKKLSVRGIWGQKDHRAYQWNKRRRIKFSKFQLWLFDFWNAHEVKKLNLKWFYRFTEINLTYLEKLSNVQDVNFRQDKGSKKPNSKVDSMHLNWVWEDSNYIWKELNLNESELNWNINLSCLNWISMGFNWIWIDLDWN